MTGGVWAALGTAFAGLCALAGMWLVQRNERQKSSTNVAQQLIDQFQEELAKRDRRIDQLEIRERLLLDYVSELRHHIEGHGKPPPPPFPPSLTR